LPASGAWSPRTYLALPAKSFVLQSECPTRFRTFVESFNAEYHPSTPTETAMVDTMASARWRLIRMSNLETAIIDYEYALENGVSTGSGRTNHSRPHRGRFGTEPQSRLEMNTVYRETNPISPDRQRKSTITFHAACTNPAPSGNWLCLGLFLPKLACSMYLFPRYAALE
jgi:hypothetical protein